MMARSGKGAAALGLTWLDWVAGTWFAAMWLGYTQLIDLPIWRRPNLNRAMVAHREAWMREMVRRENRITDAALIGHIMNSVSFFASTTIIVVAALLSALHAIDDIRAAVIELDIAHPATKAAWQFKLLLLIGLFVYAFFKFSWSIRQWNYCCVMIGATAPLGTPEADEGASRAARIATSAARAFNAGLRALYFALAMLAWFVHPLAFMVATLWVLGVLARRQFWSGSADVIVEKP